MRKVYCKDCVHLHARPAMLKYFSCLPTYICKRLSVIKRDAIGTEIVESVVDCEVANKDNSCEYHRPWWVWWGEK